MIANQQKVNSGGLMRCCLGTLAECTEEVEIGHILDCAYEPPGNANMILDEGRVWRWNRP